MCHLRSVNCYNYFISRARTANMWGDCKYKILFSSLILCLIHNGNGIPRIDPLVDSKVGLIRGLRASDGDYSMFMGIPYATVDKSNPFGVSV